MLLPEILKLEPTRVAVERAASTVSCTLEACLVTSPPAFAAEAVISIIIKGNNFLIGLVHTPNYLSE
jgi:hypothetical protein